VILLRKRFQPFQRLSRAPPQTKTIETVFLFERDFSPR
jgi:hypothetical protein